MPFERVVEKGTRIFHNVLTASAEYPRSAIPEGEGLVFGVQSAFFFFHRPPQQVSAAEGVAGQVLGDRDHLLLVDDQPVGVAEDSATGASSSGWIATTGSRSFLRLAYLLCESAPIGPGRYSAITAEIPRSCPVAWSAAAPAAAAVELEHPSVSPGSRLRKWACPPATAPPGRLHAAVGADVLDRVIEDGEVAQPGSPLDQAEVSQDG